MHFYMHGIDLNDLGIIKNDMQASSLLTYQVMDFSESGSFFNYLFKDDRFRIHESYDFCND